MKMLFAACAMMVNVKTPM